MNSRVKAISRPWETGQQGVSAGTRPLCWKGLSRTRGSKEVAAGHDFEH